MRKLSEGTASSPAASRNSRSISMMDCTSQRATASWIRRVKSGPAGWEPSGAAELEGGARRQEGDVHGDEPGVAHAGAEVVEGYGTRPVEAAVPAFGGV